MSKEETYIMICAPKMSYAETRFFNIVCDFLGIHIYHSVSCSEESLHNEQQKRRQSEENYDEPF